MLNIQINDNKIHIDFNGTGKEMLCNLSFAIHDIYNTFKKDDPEFAEAFRFALTKSLTDPRSPVWKPSAGSNQVSVADFGVAPC